MSQGIMYTCPFTVTGATAIQDLFQLIPGADTVICVHEAHIGQETELGDAAAEMLDIEISRFEDAFTEGSGGAAGAEEPLHKGSGTAKTVVEVNNTTVATSGTQAVLKRDTFHVAAGYHYVPLPSSRVWVGPTDAFILRLDTAPDDAIDLRGYIVWEEFSG